MNVYHDNNIWEKASLKVCAKIPTEDMAVFLNALMIHLCYAA